MKLNAYQVSKKGKGVQTIQVFLSSVLFMLEIAKPLKHLRTILGLILPVCVVFFGHNEGNYSWMHFLCKFLSH